MNFIAPLTSSVPSGATPKRVKIIKKTWNDEEDRRLLDLVRQYGTKEWSKHGELMDGRTGKQCRERYMNHLQVGIKKGDWTEEEDRLIVEQQSILGNQWALITRMLPGRSDNAVKNRWHAAQRHMNGSTNRAKKSKSKVSSSGSVSSDSSSVNSRSNTKGRKSSNRHPLVPSLDFKNGKKKSLTKAFSSLNNAMKDMQLNEHNAHGHRHNSSRGSTGRSDYVEGEMNLNVHINMYSAEECEAMKECDEEDDETESNSLFKFAKELSPRGCLPTLSNLTISPRLPGGFSKGHTFDCFSEYPGTPNTGRTTLTSARSECTDEGDNESNINSHAPHMKMSADNPLGMSLDDLFGGQDKFENEAATVEVGNADVDEAVDMRTSTDSLKACLQYIQPNRTISSDSGSTENETQESIGQSDSENATLNRSNSGVSSQSTSDEDYSLSGDNDRTISDNYFLSDVEDNEDTLDIGSDIESPRAATFYINLTQNNVENRKTLKVNKSRGLAPKFTFKDSEGSGSNRDLAQFILETLSHNTPRSPSLVPTKRCKMASSPRYSPRCR
jgi:hypothetical protein